MTKAVKTVLGIFDERNSAISAVELVESTEAEMNKTTIYRILDKLEENGVVHSFLGKDGIKWFAKCSGCSSQEHYDLHPHFQCRKCGRAFCLPMDLDLPDLPEHEIDTARLLLLGECQDCLK